MADISNLLLGLAVLAVIVFLSLWLIMTRNSLIAYRNKYHNMFSQIDVHLQRRFDLIPNLVEVAKKYMKHERETFEAVIAARSIAQAGLSAAKANPGDPEAMVQMTAAQGELSGALGRLMVVSEAYPELKANQNMIELSEELTSTENRIAFARQAFNDTVMEFNNKRDMFPTNIVANMFGFKRISQLEIPVEKREQVREAPKVEF